MDDVRERSLQVADGRTVAWTEAGAPDGTPLLRIPGTPGSRWSIRADRTPWLDRRLRVVTTERPGFGASTRLAGRGFREHADDLAAILDELGIERTHVMGGSGATPHVLAFAARHPDRVRAATVMVGVAPMEPQEVDRMIDLNVQSYQLASVGDVDGLRALLVPIRDEIMAEPLGMFRSIMASAPQEDQDVMADPQWQSTFVRAMTEALGQGVDGWLDEGLAIDRPWTDFSVGDVTTSVTWYHAPDDRNCPLTAAQRLVGQLPDARLVEWPGGGHLTPYLREPEILDELLARG